MNDENFVPERTEINLSEHVETLPKAGSGEITEITVEPDSELVGVYDGLHARTLKEENTYTGKMTDTQISMVLSLKDNPDLVLNPGETGSVQRFVWASPGLCKELQESEIVKGTKIKIKRKGHHKNTRWKVIHLN